MTSKESTLFMISYQPMRAVKHHVRNDNNIVPARLPFFPNLVPIGPLDAKLALAANNNLRVSGGELT